MSVTAVGDVHVIDLGDGDNRLADVERLLARVIVLGVPTVAATFSDIEGSTAAWERTPELMSEVLARHDRLLRAAIAANSGYVNPPRFSIEAVLAVRGDPVCIGALSGRVRRCAGVGVPVCSPPRQHRPEREIGTVRPRRP